MQTSWHVLIPVRGGSSAKSRLAEALPDAADRWEFATALACDVVSAALTAGSHTVSIITGDPELSERLGALGAKIIADPGTGGLDGAVAFAADAVRRDDPTSGIAVLMGDVPELTAAALDEALNLAATADLGVVSDHDGTGTTLLTARPPRVPHPSYGAGSFSRHRSLGHEVLDVPADSPLRGDIDSPEDLDRLRHGRPGRFTADICARLGLGPGFGIGIGPGQTGSRA